MVNPDTPIMFERIPESEYTAHLDGVLLDLAKRIARSGLSLSQIARGTRMSRNTVHNASQGVPVSFTNACRLYYYLQQQNEETE